jgi:hypothetical protein
MIRLTDRAWPPCLTGALIGLWQVPAVLPGTAPGALERRRPWRAEPGETADGVLPPAAPAKAVLAEPAAP